MKRILMLLVILFNLVILFGCTKNITIKFNTSGGEVIQSVELEDINDFTLPENPTKKGYKFKGWFIDDEFTKEFTSLEDLGRVSNVMLYAKWEEIKKYRVEFKNSYLEGVYVKEGEKLTKPNDPVKYGYFFLGWFLDEALVNEYNFEEVVTSDITLYAKWEKHETFIQVNEDPTIVDGAYIDKYRKDDTLTIDNKIKKITTYALKAKGIKKLYFNGTEDEFRKIQFHKYVESNTDNVKEFDIYINNELIGFEIVSQIPKTEDEEICIEAEIYLNDEYLESIKNYFPKNCKLTVSLIEELFRQNRVFHLWGGVGTAFMKFYTDPNKENELDITYFDNLTESKKLYVYINQDKNYIEDISGTYHAGNGVECIIEDSKITIWGETIDLTCFSSGGGASFYHYEDDIYLIDVSMYNSYIYNQIYVDVLDMKLDLYVYHVFVIDSN